VPEATHVKLEVINLLGQRVATLVDRQMTAGTHVVDWHGRDDAGQTVATGIYFYRLIAGEFTGSKKMLLLK
jgi:flagellar hook assembly protein FlgD